MNNKSGEAFIDFIGPIVPGGQMGPGRPMMGPGGPAPTERPQTYGCVQCPFLTESSNAMIRHHLDTHMDTMDYPMGPVNYPPGNYIASGHGGPGPTERPRTHRCVLCPFVTESSNAIIRHHLREHTSYPMSNHHVTAA